MDSLREQAVRRQIEELAETVATLTGNNPSATSTDLVLSDDRVARQLGEALFQQEQLQKLTLTLVAVHDPTQGTGMARVVEYVRTARNLSSLSLVTVYLMMGPNNYTLLGREEVIDALLKAATGNSSIQRLRLNCCSYAVSRLVAMLRESSVKRLKLLNCRLSDGHFDINSSAALLNALKQCRHLGTFHARRSFEQIQLEGEILESLMHHPALTDFGYSVRTPLVAFGYRRLVESFDRTMKFVLLGSSLNRESVVAITEGFAARRFNFSVDLQGCTWGTRANRDDFVTRLFQSRHLTSLSIDKHCGFSSRTRETLMKIVALHYRLAAITGAVEGPDHWQQPQVGCTPGSLAALLIGSIGTITSTEVTATAIFLAMRHSNLVQHFGLDARLPDAVQIAS